VCANVRRNWFFVVILMGPAPARSILGPGFTQLIRVENTVDSGFRRNDGRRGLEPIHPRKPGSKPLRLRCIRSVISGIDHDCTRCRIGWPTACAGSMRCRCTVSPVDAERHGASRARQRAIPNRPSATRHKETRAQGSYPRGWYFLCSSFSLLRSTCV
jgi:hypothetical protein